MIEFERARQQLMAQARPLASTEIVALVDALGMVLAEAVVSAIDVPPADNSAVDGYALAFDAYEKALGKGDVAHLSVSQRVTAGDVPEALRPGTAARIFTGATVPENADAVVMQESVMQENVMQESVMQENVSQKSSVQNSSEKKNPAIKRNTFADERIALSRDLSLTRGQNIRRRGQDVCASDVIVAQGEKLTPWHLGLLASVGVDQVCVFKPLRIAVLSTGDELQEPGETPLPGKIFNSNRYLMLTLIRACGFIGIDGGRVADTLDATRTALTDASARADLVLTSGGVSVGEEDHVRAAVETLGALTLWKIAIKPGKPFAFGDIGGALFAGLPGNPSAVLVTFLVLLKPFLDRCQGRVRREPVERLVRCGFSVKPGRRQEYLRVQLSEDQHGACLVLHPNQSSGMLSSACWADGLAVLAADREIKEGDTAPFLSFEELLH